jgi:regulator of sirC expression with transglutaminase-like and TPR domain
VPLDGVNFPGHFLVRHRSGRRSAERDLIIDPFHGGAVLGPSDLRALLRKVAGDDAEYDRRLLIEASEWDTLVRMTTNLKRTYVSMRSYAHARAATDLLLALDPLAIAELRDRGLLAYHLRDFGPALRDLEGYLAAASRSAGAVDEEQREEYQQVWEHVKALRRRVAGFN